MIGDILKRAYNNHKAHARARGIVFAMTFEQWLRVWVRSGHLSDRGRGVGKYHMARRGDRGPYAVDNVKIISHSQNASEVVRDAAWRATCSAQMVVRWQSGIYTGKVGRKSA